MSLLDNGTFTMTEVPSYGFFALISATNIEGRTSSVNSMRNLVLPARTVKSCGYSCMFASNEACINGPRIGVRYVEYEAFDSTFFCNYSLNNVYIEYPGAFDVKSEGEFYQ
ncbi:MAG: hypothetical protein MJ233_05015 [Mycoplasmoidaceae bacterium]|nr:hypothetical protein [Mycoplasmoidaceae bacterium]